MQAPCSRRACSGRARTRGRLSPRAKGEEPSENRRAAQSHGGQGPAGARRTPGPAQARPRTRRLCLAHQPTGPGRAWRGTCLSKRQRPAPGGTGSPAERSGSGSDRTACRLRSLKGPAPVPAGPARVKPRPPVPSSEGTPASRAHARSAAQAVPHRAQPPSSIRPVLSHAFMPGPVQPGCPGPGTWSGHGPPAGDEWTRRLWPCPSRSWRTPARTPR
jgi:hypothetical protein